MVLPTPPVPLKDHCSVIYNNVLYTYQVDAFQSLDLKMGGNWTKLPMGVPTNGSTCVQGTVNNDNAFIVVGGIASGQKYDGLQHYSFSSSKWQSDNPLDSVSKNRVGHGSAYLQQSSSILVYGGSQMNRYTPSSETFLMQTTPPYNVQAFNSIAPPVADPLMMPWNSTHALMLGGNIQNTALFTFGPDEGWRQLNVSLPNPLKDSSKVQASVLDGNDGGKVLQIFDMSTSPNQITTLLLQNATGTSRPSKRSRSPSQHHPARRRKRDIPIADRPAYNNTLAPQDTRNGYSLASDPKNGLVVASGGGDQVPLALFNETGNQWIDPNTFFGAQSTLTSSASPTSSAASASGTASAAAASSSVAAASTHVKNKSLTILGGVLGGVFGFAILLVILLLLIKFCRRRKAKKREQQDSSYSLENKAEMDFQDVGADFMKEAGGNFESNHRRNRSDRSHVGAGAVAADRADRGGGAVSSQSKRALLHAKGDSAGSGKSFWSRGTKSPDKDRTTPFISAPIIEPFDGGPAAGPSVSPDPRTEPRTDTGWSRYWANNNSRDLNTMTAAHEQDIRPATYLSNSQSQSDYTDSRTTSSHPHASAEVQPLSLRTSQNPFVYPPNSRIMSPTGYPRTGLALSHGRSPTPSDEPPSPTSLVSDIEEEDEYTRNSHSDGQDSWSPVASSGERGSAYSDPRNTHISAGTTRDSTKFPHPGERVKIPNFPAVPDSQKGSKRNSGVGTPTSPVNDNRGLRNIASKDFAGAGAATSGRASPIPETTGASRLPEYGASQVRPFPRKREDMGARGRGGPQTEDMSWLNLGASGEHSGNEHLRYG
ncbi:hypothetical protein ACLMJK_003938 [Lecanora helva]